MARALIIGCGCRGRELGATLLGRGWQVRGTTRRDSGLAAIEAIGIEARIADPDRIASVVELLDDVSLVVWALGSVDDGASRVLNGPRLNRILEQVVDTPVRAFIYDSAEIGSGMGPDLGSRLVRKAGERWRIPVAIVQTEPSEWARTVADRADRLLGPEPGLPARA
ncbi:MAG: hypothetical protein M3383_00790 [Actinomycetota bacterium]|nr:hypothetical protein [Actinomycetota bacterium]